MLKKTVLCKWPIKFLQDNLQGICTGDLIVVACASGTGKSTISRLITMGARDDKCPVVLYSLENQAGSYATEETRNAMFRAGVASSDLRGFAIADTADQKKFEQYRRDAYSKSKQTDASGLPLLVVHEDVATDDWNIKRLVKSMRQEIAQGYRLFVIDHLDVLAPNDEYNETTVAMRELWALVATNNIAIITFSQLAKKTSALCPGQYDLRGGMNKVYKSTHLITLGKHEYGYYQPPLKYPDALPTYMRIAKSRDTKLACAVCYFNHGEYIDEYMSVACDEPGTYIDGMTREKLQKWKQKQNDHKVSQW